MKSWGEDLEFSAQICPNHVCGAGRFTYMHPQRRISIGNMKANITNMS